MVLVKDPNKKDRQTEEAHCFIIDTVIVTRGRGAAGGGGGRGTGVGGVRGTPTMY